MPGRDKDWEGARGGPFVPMPDTGETAPAPTSPERGPEAPAKVDVASCRRDVLGLRS